MDRGSSIRGGYSPSTRRTPVTRGPGNLQASTPQPSASLTQYGAALKVSRSNSASPPLTTPERPGVGPARFGRTHAPAGRRPSGLPPAGPRRNRLGRECGTDAEPSRASMTPFVRRSFLPAGSGPAGEPPMGRNTRIMVASLGRTSLRLSSLTRSARVRSDSGWTAGPDE
jgi:hypothetical protein